MHAAAYKHAASTMLCTMPLLRSSRSNLLLRKSTSMPQPTSMPLYKHIAAMLLCTMSLLRSSKRISHLRSYKHTAAYKHVAAMLLSTMSLLRSSKRISQLRVYKHVALQAYRSDAAKHHVASTKLYKHIAVLLLYLAPIHSNKNLSSYLI